MVWWGPVLGFAIEVLSMIGRWVLRRIAVRGRKWILHYMRERVEVFQERHAMARTERRKAWLSGRILRWNRAIEWIEDNVPRLSKRWADKLYDKLKNRVDEYVPYEEYPEAA